MATYPNINKDCEENSPASSNFVDTTDKDLPSMDGFTPVERTLTTASDRASFDCVV